jgi:hypothetical protein
VSGVNIIDFVHQLETALNIPQGGNNDAFFVAWQKAEGNPGIHQNNPWNIATATGRPFGGTAGAAGTAVFPTAAQGVQATAAYILASSQPGQKYAQFYDDLQANADPSTTAIALGRSPWASGHYDPTDPKQGAVDYGTEPGHSIIGALGSNGSKVGVTGIPGAIANIVSNPGSTVSSVVGQLVPDIGTDAKSVAIFAVLLAGGVGLVLLGAWRFAAPAVHQAADRVGQLGTAAAVAA